MVIVQIAAISQIEIFGANADLTPLVVACAGLLVGSLPGAAFGFGVGLFLDLALVQTVGMSSLLFLGIGYGAGRLRELRDPQGAIVPVAVGAAATLLAQLGFSLMQFLLGREVPLDPALDLADPRDGGARRAAGDADLRGRAPLADAGPAGGPAAPAPARVHDRRPLAALEVVSG